MISIATTLCRHTWGGSIVRAVLLLLSAGWLMAAGPGWHAVAIAQPAGTNTSPSPSASPGATPSASPNADTPQSEIATDSSDEFDTILFPTELRNTVSRSRAEIERLSKSVERVGESDEQLELLRPEIEDILNNSQRTENDLVPLLDVVKRQVSALGKPPEKDAPPEAANIAAERARLNQVVAEIEGAIKQSNLTHVRARQLLSRLQTLRLRNLDRDLRQRRAPPTSCAHWQALLAALPRFGQQIVTVADNWWAIALPNLHWFVLIVIGTVLLWWQLRQFVLARIQSWLNKPLQQSPPAYLMRVEMAVRTLPLLLLPGLVSIGFFYVALVMAGLLNQQVDEMAVAAVKALGLFLIVKALAKAVLLPSNAPWRLIGLPTAAARRYLWLTYWIAGVYAFDLWCSEIFQALYVQVPIRIAETLVSNLTFAVLLLMFAWSPRSEVAESEERISAKLAQTALFWLRMPASIAVAAIVVATLLGYYALGRFIAGQVMLVGVTAALLLLGHLATRAISREPEALVGDMAGAGEPTRATSDPRMRWALWLLGILINVALLLFAAAFILLSWGFSQSELIGWGKSLLFGFEIGTYRFSLVQISIAVALFVAALAVTRGLQSWVSNRALRPDQMDRGVANSIRSGIGYLGVIVAALVGVSFAGLDLSSFAIFASALTIAIGFGVNQIAGNFVSGLIMLIERPIKVGDWVVVGEYQGHVRHISVRATEIETFDRASVIIPNSDFMTNAVQNWTHRNSMARVIIPIGASYSADPHKVIEVLREVANQSSHLLKYPAPSVHFEEFGASSLDFTLRGYIADVNSSLSSKTALRLAITDAFREAAIEIPFPQQDVHLRDLDGVRELVTAAMRRRAGELRTENAEDAAKPTAAAGEPKGSSAF